MTVYGTTVGLEGCFTLTQRTNRHTFIISFPILQQREKKQQMDRNNRGRGRRSLASVFTPQTAHPTLKHTNTLMHTFVNMQVCTFPQIDPTLIPYEEKFISLTAGTAA